MKKKIQAIACAAMLAVGGMNAYMAIGSGTTESELQILDVEMLAEAEDANSSNHWEPISRSPQYTWENGHCTRSEVEQCLRGGSTNCIISKFRVCQITI